MQYVKCTMDSVSGENVDKIGGFEERFRMLIDKRRIRDGCTSFNKKGKIDEIENKDYSRLTVKSLKRTIQSLAPPLAFLALRPTSRLQSSMFFVLM